MKNCHDDKNKRDIKRSLLLESDKKKSPFTYSGRYAVNCYISINVISPSFILSRKTKMPSTNQMDFDLNFELLKQNFFFVFNYQSTEVDYYATNVYLASNIWLINTPTQIYDKDNNNWRLVLIITGYCQSLATDKIEDAINDDYICALCVA